MRNESIIYIGSSAGAMIAGSDLRLCTDKNYEEMCALTKDRSIAYLCVCPDNPRALKAEALREQLLPLGKPVYLMKDMEGAIALSKELAGEEAFVCAFGSLYMAGEIRSAYHKLSNL